MSVGSSSLQTGISWILRVGVLISVVFEVSGLLLDYAQTGSASLCLSGPSCDVWRVAGGNFFDFAYSSVGSALVGLRPVDLVSLGIVSLMFTPYFRVVAAVVYYAVERDWKYVLITSFVTALITTALLVF